MNLYDPLQNTLILILVWSGGQVWSDGLLRFLKAYTFDFLIMVRINYYCSKDFKLKYGYIEI